MQDLNDKITGGTLTATEWNEVPSEIQNVIEGLGITLSSGDLNQLGKAIAGYVANGTFYTDSGAADAYVLTTIGLKQSLTAYTNGMVIRFIAGNTNAGGAATVNVAALGPKTIALGGGNPNANIISTTSENIAVFDIANDRFNIVNVERIVDITVSGTYTRPDGLLFADVLAIGAGAAGGGVDGQGAGTFAAGAGGSAAGWGRSILTANEIGTSQTVTIGAGGVGVSAANGGDGGATSFGALVVADGGNGGAFDAATSILSVTSGRDGGTGTTGQILGDGTASGNGVAVGTTATGAGSGFGGASFLGGGVSGAGGDTAGGTATTPGAGGSGAVVTDVATNFAGGDGADGIVIIREIF